MKNRIAVLIGLAALTVSLVCEDRLIGQERKQERPLRHDAAATVKLIAVRVLGQDGRPVHGLRKEDFTLYEDGQAKTITEFEVHTITEKGMTITPALPPSGEAAGRAVGAASRKLFLFLDQQASDREGKDKAKTAALHFLDTQVRPGDQVAVLGWYAMAGFYIREYLTSDLDRIRRAINGVTEAPPSPGEVVGGSPDDSVDEGLPDSLPARNAAATVAAKNATISSVPSGGGGGSAVLAPGTAAFQRLDFIPRLAEITEIFKTIPGSKNLILFTARNMGPDAERLGRLFGAAGTAVFAVNTQDWKIGPFGTKFKYLWNDHSLKDLSAASGGKYFADINDAAGISREVQDLTGNYYILGYYVQDSWEGKYHKIRVEVKRPDVRVLVQDGFADSKPFDRLSDFEKDIQLLDLLWSDEPSLGSAPLALDTLVVAAAKTMAGCFLTKWDVGTKTGPPAAPVQVFVLLRDPAGTALVSRKWDVDLSTYDGRTVWAYFTNSLAVGPHDMRLVIRDKKTGISFVGRARFDSTAPVEEDIVLFSPLLFEDGLGVSFLKLPTGRLEARKEKPAAGPSIQSLYRLIPKEGLPVVGEVSPGTKHLLAVIPFEMRPHVAEDTPILSVEAKLVSRHDGRETPLEAEIREHMTYEGSPDILAVDLALPEMVPGAYVLEITIEDMGTNRRSTVRKALTIRS